MKKFSLITGAVLAVSLLASPAQAASDLPNTHRFYEEMTYLQTKGVISGFEDGTMRPDQTVSRAEAAIMIGKLKGLDGTQRGTKFADVPANLKASGYIASAAQAGYISGYMDGSFKPNAPITRGDMAIILSYVFPLAMQGLEDFKDVSPNMRAYEAIGHVVSGSIAAGYQDNTFKPTNATTRAQFAAFLSRGLEPKFQNDTHMKGSYLMDKTKTYSFQWDDGDIEKISYVKPKGELAEDWNFLWKGDFASGDSYYLVDIESSEFHATGEPFSEFFIDLVYPVKSGTKFNEDSPYGPAAQITKTGVTVKTKYKTFTNAVEVTVPADKDFDFEGRKYYMVAGYGNVKAIDLAGHVLAELISVK